MDGGEDEPGARDAGRRERKQRVLHTRISDDLADDIRRVAEDLRVPVSNLVRNVLEEAFSVVETVTDNVGGLIEDVVEEAERARARLRRRSERPEPSETEAPPAAGAPPTPPRAGFADVLGWQPLILNGPQSCADCDESLEQGQRAYVGAVAAGISPHFLCPDCADARRR
ncbi:MAG: hypothetical protein OEM05_09335 [Myxococcales bacterium]|nr:hypothetical protein [Myxococcales bacterium]